MHKLLLILTLLVSAAFADQTVNIGDNYSKEANRIAATNISDRCFACAVYLSIAAEGMRRDEKSVEAENIDAVATQFSNLGASLALSIGIPLTEVQDKVNSLSKQQSEEMNYDYANFAILKTKYDAACRQLYENMEDEIKSELEKAK